MRRADRLFEIIQLMRRQKLVRARDLAEKLEVSERTIYRDVRDLMASRVPIEGEAGVGYALRSGFDLPPLMFDEHEIEALVLGARIIEFLDRCQAGRGRRQRHRQSRGGDPGAAAPAHGRYRAARPRRTLRPPDHRGSRASCAGRCGAGSKCISATATARNGRAPARCGRSRCPSTARPGCSRRGASCARTSARSGWIACRSSTCWTSAFAWSLARPSRTF